MNVIFNAIVNISIVHYLLLSAVLFCIGIFGVIICKNIIKVLMSIEIMLTAVNINFIAFANFTDFSGIQGQIFAIFVMAIAAIEAAVGLAILISLYKNKPTVDAEKYNDLKG
ncbi:MAG: NADH-quinone oxidoreductase subunit NuoK [Candidatus Gastranaerophilaceae bacterium]